MSQSASYRPCYCDNCQPGEPFTPDQCRLCWLFYDRSPLGAAYHEHWAVAMMVPAKALADTCRHPERGIRGIGGEGKQGLRAEDSGPEMRGLSLRGYEIGDPETAQSGCVPSEGFVLKEPVPNLVSVGRAEAPLQPEELTPTTPVEDVVRLLEGGPADFPDGWADWANVRQAHILLLEQAIAHCPPYPTDRYQGRGIVTCVSAKPGWSSGKNLPHGYFPGAWVLVHELRRLGCTLPITFAYLGPLEWDLQLTQLVRPLGVEVLDLHAAQRHDPMRILEGWETKVYAIQQAPYEEVLFLDADNVPACNPTFLFDEPRYREAGALFWPDLPPYDRPEWLPETVWRNVGLERQDEFDFESGQLLIDKRRCWRELMATRHLNEHSDWYYRFIFGDKSTFHLAWAKCGTPWAMPSTPAGWLHRSILQHDFDGRVLFHHACQDKPSLYGYNDRGHLPHEAICDAHLAKLRRLWTGRLWANDNPSPVDRATRDRLCGRVFDYHRLGLDRRPLRFLADDRIGRGAGRCEFTWTVQAGILAVCDCDGRPTFLAHEATDGTWRGRWLEYERCEVILTPLSADQAGELTAYANGNATAAMASQPFSRRGD